MSKVVEELTKDHREDDEAEGGGIMYATGGPFCLVASFEKYLQHLNPQNEFLFQRPKKKLTPDSDVWYDNMVVGERSLGEMTKQISKQAGLSKDYTNHNSIRATAVTILDKSGFEARHILSLGGHRSESSIRSYSKTDESTKKRMSETLTAGAVSEVSAVSLENQLAERHVAVSPILSLSQEEHIMRDVHLSSNSQVKKQYTFHNCNVIFN